MRLPSIQILSSFFQALIACLLVANLSYTRNVTHRLAAKRWVNRSAIEEGYDWRRILDRIAIGSSFSVNDFDGTTEDILATTRSSIKIPITQFETMLTRIY